MSTAWTDIAPQDPVDGWHRYEQASMTGNAKTDKATPKKAPRVCRNDGCGRKHKAFGYCRRCYKRAMAAGQIEPSRRCSNDWCDRPHSARGFCAQCYWRGWMSGDWTRATRKYREWERQRLDVDPVAVQRLIAGDPPERTTVGEREAAVRELHAQGASDREIAFRLSLPMGSVGGIRRRLGLAPAGGAR